MATLRGFAIVTDALSEDIGFRERIKRQAIERALARHPDVLALVDHDRTRVIGRSSAGTLHLKLEPKGLLAEIDVAPTTAGNDVVASVRRRDTRGMSFSFRVPRGGDEWTVEGETLMRTITDMLLLDVTVTAVPAYLQTTVDVVERTVGDIASAQLAEIELMRLQMESEAQFAREQRARQQREDALLELYSRA